MASSSLGASQPRLLDADDNGSWTSVKRWSQLNSRFGLIDWAFLVLCAILLAIIDNFEPYHKPMTQLLLADPDISLPYLASIIPDGLLIFLAIILPALVILGIFVFRRHQAGSGTELRLALLAFFMCVVINLIATDFGKKYVGRPRPNFVEYTGYFNGTYSNSPNLRDAFQSWPSGHASTSFAGLGFLSLYCYFNLYVAWRLGSQTATKGVAGLFSSSPSGVSSTSPVAAALVHRREDKDRAYGVSNNQLSFLFLLSLPLWLAAYIAMTRVRDNHHRPDDILAGAVLGILIAYGSYKGLYLRRRNEWFDENTQAFKELVSREAAEQERERLTADPRGNTHAVDARAGGGSTSAPSAAADSVMSPNDLEAGLLPHGSASTSPPPDSARMGGGAIEVSPEHQH